MVNWRIARWASCASSNSLSFVQKECLASSLYTHRTAVALECLFGYTAGPVWSFFAAALLAKFVVLFAVR